MYHITGTYWVAVMSAWGEERGMRAEFLVDSESSITQMGEAEAQMEIHDKIWWSH